MGLSNSWKITRSHLATARQFVPNDTKSSEGYSLERYEEWLQHNELGLAFDELFGLGAERSFGRDFWLALAAAATNMKLEDEARQCQEAAEKA